MSRVPLGHFLIAGLLFWGIPAVIVAGPSVILYTIAAVLPVWFLCRHNSYVTAPEQRRLSLSACTIMAGFSVAYLMWDATFGRQLLQFNMFFFRGAAADKLIESINQGMSKGGGIADLLGNILALLPFALIDAARNTSRYGRWILWVIALLFLIYEVGSGRGFLMMALVAIVLGRTSDWRRILAAAALALPAFAVASTFRGDYGNVQNPFLSGTITPFINLGLMLNAHCGSAPWYSFIVEFLKKFFPAFLISKTVFSFNLEMSLCIYPSIDNTVSSVSVFTWLGEIFYYTPSLLTAILAGALLGYLGRVVDRRFVRNGMHSARLFAGFICFLLPRSRTQDIFTFLIAQIIFLVIVWPQLRGFTRTMRRYFIPVHPEIQPEPGKEPL